jgi:hypothetical protein
MYFKTQSAALFQAEQEAQKKGYEVQYPNSFFGICIYSEQYGKYSFELKCIKSGNIAKKMLHITLYRMPSGNYELVNYIN